MSEAPARDRVEAVIISGPARGRIVELTPDSLERTLHDEDFGEGDLAVLNAALDTLIGSLDRLEAQFDKAICTFEERGQRYAREHPGDGAEDTHRLAAAG